MDGRVPYDNPFEARRSRAVWLVWLVSLGAVGLMGWDVTDQLESRNEFCNACHLPSGVPLHRDIAADFGGDPPASLAAAHAVAGNTERADGGFRCIDCHGGVGLHGRVRVKLLAARDALVWATGRFEEPQGMRHPLWDQDCSQCHPTFEAEDPDGLSAGFHELPVHNVDLGVNCVECHVSHERTGPDTPYFLDAPLVRAQCARCHPEFEEGGR